MKDLHALHDAFKQTWSKVSSSNPDLIFDAIVGHYSEPHRHYHNLTHIAACLDELASLQLADPSLTEIELAIWFHDIIYNVSAKDNEASSAAFFRSIAEPAGLDRQLIDTVCRMILATWKHEIPQDFDRFELKTFLDIDLSILGANADRFRRYNEGIRSEYSWVPAFLYKRKRKQVLQRFLKRETLYFTEAFRSRYEQKARENIQAVLKG